MDIIDTEIDLDLDEYRVLDIDHISHSSLGALSVSPLYFRKYKEKELEEYKSRSLDLGSAIHCYVLRPTDFNSEYFTNDVAPVGGMMGTFIETLVAIEKDDFEGLDGRFSDNTLDDIYILAYEQAGFKTKIETVIKNFEKPENQEYYNLLRKHYGMIHLSSKEFSTLVNCNNAIIYHKLCNALFVKSPLDNRLCFNEKEVLFSTDDTIFKSDNYEFKIKSIIDRLVVDRDSKTIYLIDLKTTSSSVYNFESSYRKYAYYRQLALYKQSLIAALPGIGVADYTIKCYIVAVQTTGLNECVVYEPSEKDLKKGEKEIQSLIDRLVWHSEKNSWDYPKEYYETDSVVEICISNDEVISKEEEYTEESKAE
tara:strand:- start:6089 stop:7189 length:1101 start_codon:yes stop_codon:yes gene_type:complete